MTTVAALATLPLPAALAILAVLVAFASLSALATHTSHQETGVVVDVRWLPVAQPGAVRDLFDPARSAGGGDGCHADDGRE